MGFITRLLRREAAVELAGRNRLALLRFRLGGGLVPYGDILKTWPELAPLGALVPQPGRLETAIGEDRLPEALALIGQLAEAHSGEAKLRFAVAPGLLEPRRREPPAPRKEPEPEPEPEPGPADSAAFFRDARALLARTEPEAEPAPMALAYPRYALMSPAQQKWYFYLRGELRAGRCPDTPYGYLLLYLYELVNGLGVEDPRQELDALAALWRDYRERCPALSGAPARWIWDYVRANGLDVSPSALLFQLPGLPDLVADAMLTAAEDAGEPLRLPAALLGRLGDYDLASSRFFQQAADREVLEAQLSDAVAAVDAALRQACGRGLLSAHSLSRVQEQPVTAFRGAPVTAERRYTLRRKRCLNNPRLSAWLGPVLRYIENGLRARHRFPGRLKNAEPDALCRAAVDACLAALDPAAGERPAAPGPAPKLALDMESVLRLRAESNAVRDALLAAVAEDAPPEDEDDGPIPWDDPPEAPAPPPEPAVADDPWAAFLARADREALAALLQGPDALSALARRRGRMPASLLDGLNEIASETLGDLIADEGGVFEEYADELARRLT